jgi:hypothetical protein
MALIRTKRATTAGQNGGPGQPKSKYRKRSVSRASLIICHLKCSNFIFYQRATPPGKCHSCNIRETPEWRRGPDGARTLCNACGLRELIPLYSFVPVLFTFMITRLRKVDAQAGQGDWS